MESCWPMGYVGYQLPQKEQLRQRIKDALNPQSHVSSWVAQHTCDPDDERDPALFLVTIDRSKTVMHPRSEFRCRASALPHLASPFSLELLLIYRIQSLLSSFSLSLSLPFSQVKFNAAVPYCACNFVSFSCNQGP